MTVKEIVAQAEQLPLDERWLVVSELLRSLQNETLAAAADKKQLVDQADDEFSAARMRGILKDKQTPSTPKRSSLDRVLGMLTPDGPMPTDEELKEDYTDYLIKKYL